MSDSITRYNELVEEGKINKSTEVKNHAISKPLIIKRITDIKNILLFCGSKSGLTNEDSAFMAVRSINTLLDEIKNDELAIGNPRLI